MVLIHGCAIITTMDDVVMDRWFNIPEGQVLTLKLDAYLAQCDEIRYHCLYGHLGSKNRDTFLSIPAGTEVEFIQAKLRGNMFWVYPYAVVRIKGMNQSKTIMVGGLPYNEIF